MPVICLNDDLCHMNVLVTIDNRYVEPLATMLRSFMDTNGDTVTDLYIAHSSVTDESLRYLDGIVEGSNVTIHSVRITERWFTGIPVLERLPEESFYRLLAFHFLPQDMDRCLYLDPDIWIRKSLQPLYDTDLDGYYIAAAGHLRGYQNFVNKKRLSLKGQERYVNSGIVLMNLDEIRKDFTLDDVLMSLEENVQKLIMGDQDMVNILFGRRLLLIPEEIYNLDERVFRYLKKRKGWTVDTVAERTAIIHYNGKCKPWLEGYEGELNTFYPEVKDKGPAPSNVAKKHVKSFLRITRPSLQQVIVISGMLLFVAVCVLSYIFFGSKLQTIAEDPELFREWLDRFGPFDEVVFILIRAAQTVVKFIPAEPLEIASGYAWGIIPGALYCLIGNMIGTVIIFMLTKRYGRKVLEMLMPVKNRRILNAFKENDNLYAVLFFLYLIPGSPKDGFTYFAGLLPVRLAPFMVVTSIARIPSILTSTVCGALLAEKQYWVALGVFLGTAVLAVLGGIAYKKFMDRRSRKRNGNGA